MTTGSEQNVSRPAPRLEQTDREREEAEDLVQELLTRDEEQDDLDWLYSNADEYSPSDLTGDPVRAQSLPGPGEGSPRLWNARWRRFDTVNYVVTGLGVGAAVVASLIPPAQTPWRTRNSFDEWGRRNLGASTYPGGLWARDLSDLLVSVNLTFPFLVDSLIVTHWYRASPDVAAQMALITTEAMAVSVALQTLTSALASRERPFARDCGRSIDARLSDCLENDRFRSFFSGHASNAFTGAAVTCSHHARHAVFGNTLADGVTCGVALASAATVSTMRVVGQRHYLSDILTGASIGMVSGWGVPWLLHYGPLAAGTETGTNGARVGIAPLPNGLALWGRF